MDILKNTFDDYFVRVRDWLSFEINTFFFRHSMHGVRSTMRDYNIYMSINIKFRNPFGFFFKFHGHLFRTILTNYKAIIVDCPKLKTMQKHWNSYDPVKRKLTVSFQFIYLHKICRMGNNHEEKLKMNIRVNFCDMTSLIINTKIFQERYCRPSFVKMWPSRQFSYAYIKEKILKTFMCLLTTKRTWNCNWQLCM